MPTSPRDNPGAIAPAPLLYLIPLLFGLLLQRARPARLAPAGALIALRVSGGVLVALGVILAITAILVFRRAGTPVNPIRPTTALVTAGPYRLTRNPMYLGLALLYLGITLLVDSSWPLLLLPVVLFIVRLGVIDREERYLDRKFGEAYQRYKAGVQRWF